MKFYIEKASRLPGGESPLDSPYSQAVQEPYMGPESAPGRGDQRMVHAWVIELSTLEELLALVDAISPYMVAVENDFWTAHTNRKHYPMLMVVDEEL
jgi:hypothetical protein